MIPLSTSLLPKNWATKPISEIAQIAPTQLLSWPLLNEAGVEIAIKREDLLDPRLGGNKFYKLHYHLERMAQGEAETLITFGGPYSNHIAATAAAGHRLGIATVGIIRGHHKRPSPTLVQANELGMRLLYVTRAEYRDKTNPEWLRSIEERVGTSVYWVPEGGGDAIGARGCAQWAEQAIRSAPWDPTHLCVAAGTGGTAAGFLAASKNIPVHAFLVLKAKDSQLENFSEYIRTMANEARTSLSSCSAPLPDFHLESAFHCGGYARFPDSLREFMRALELQLQIPLDPVYTAKLFWGIAQKAERGEWPKGSRILVFHTGGLQGRCGFDLD